MSKIQINPQCVVGKRWSVVALWNARPTNEPQRVIMIHLAVHCTGIHVMLYQARALRALGLLLADGAPTVGGGKTF